MRGKLLEGNRLSRLEKFSRLCTRLRDPEWRRFGLTLMAGKFLGLALLIGGILAVTYWMRSGVALADSPTTQAAVAATQPAAVDPYAAAKGGDLINPLNT